MAEAQIGDEPVNRLRLTVENVKALSDAEDRKIKDSGADIPENGKNGGQCRPPVDGEKSEEQNSVKEGVGTGEVGSSSQIRDSKVSDGQGSKYMEECIDLLAKKGILTTEKQEELRRAFEKNGENLGSASKLLVEALQQAETETAVSAIDSNRNKQSYTSTLQARDESYDFYHSTDGPRSEKSSHRKKHGRRSIARLQRNTKNGVLPVAIRVRQTALANVIYLRVSASKVSTWESFMIFSIPSAYPTIISSFLEPHPAGSEQRMSTQQHTHAETMDKNERGRDVSERRGTEGGEREVKHVSEERGHRGSSAVEKTSSKEYRDEASYPHDLVKAFSTLSMLRGTFKEDRRRTHAGFAQAGKDTLVLKHRPQICLFLPVTKWWKGAWLTCKPNTNNIQLWVPKKEPVAINSALRFDVINESERRSSLTHPPGRRHSSLSLQDSGSRGVTNANTDRRHTLRGGAQHTLTPMQEDESGPERARPGHEEEYSDEFSEDDMDDFCSAISGYSFSTHSEWKPPFIFYADSDMGTDTEQQPPGGEEGKTVGVDSSVGATAVEEPHEDEPHISEPADPVPSEWAKEIKPDFFEADRDSFVEVMDEVLPINVKTVFDLFYRDQSTFNDERHKENGNTNVNMTKWYKHPKFGFVRKQTFTMPIAGLPGGKKQGDATEYHSLQLEGLSELTFNAKTYMPDIPYGSYFSVEAQITFVNETESSCRGVAYCAVHFTKSTLFKRGIIAGTISGSRKGNQQMISLMRRKIKEELGVDS